MFPNYYQLLSITDVFYIWFKILYDIEVEYAQLFPIVMESPESSQREFSIKKTELE